MLIYNLIFLLGVIIITILEVHSSEPNPIVSFKIVSPDSSKYVKNVTNDQFHIFNETAVGLECLSASPIKIIFSGIMPHKIEYTQMKWDPREKLYNVTIGFNSTPQATGPYSCVNADANETVAFNSTIYLFCDDGKSKPFLLQWNRNATDAIEIRDFKNQSEILLPCLTFRPSVTPELFYVRKDDTVTEYIPVPKTKYSYNSTEGFLIDLKQSSETNACTTFKCQLTSNSSLTFTIPVARLEVDPVGVKEVGRIFYWDPNKSGFFVKCKGISAVTLAVKKGFKKPKHKSYQQVNSSFYEYMAEYSLNTDDPQINATDFNGSTIACTGSGLNEDAFTRIVVIGTPTYPAPASNSNGIVLNFNKETNMLYHCSNSSEKTPKMTLTTCANLADCEIAQRFTSIQQINYTLKHQNPYSIERNFLADENTKKEINVTNDTACAVIKLYQFFGYLKSGTVGMVHCFFLNKITNDEIKTSAASFQIFPDLNNNTVIEGDYKSLMSVLRITTSGTVFMGEVVTFTCEASVFIFTGGLEMIFTYKNVMGANKTVHHYPRNFTESSNMYKITRNETVYIRSKDLESVECRALKWNQKQWENVSLKIEVRGPDFKSNYNIKSAESSWHVYVITSIGIIVLALIVAIAMLYKTLKSQQNEIQSLSTVEIANFMNGNKDIAQKFRELHEIAQYLPYNQEYEIHKSKIDMKTEILGSGNYGMVLKGVLEKSGKKFPVAVKTVKSGTDISHLRSLLSELKIMMYIGKHPHIIEMVGAITKDLQEGKLFVAVEFCSNGNLQSHLRLCRQVFQNQIVEDEIKVFPEKTKCETKAKRHSKFLGIDISNAIEKRRSRHSQQPSPVTTINLITWCQQISSGMEYLVDKKVIHGDLATRNILITDSLSVKITDFGLARHLYEYTDYVTKQKTDALPWRWLSIEAIKDSKFSTESDVWAYGVTLWEIFSLGEIPYQGFSWGEEFVQELSNGYRMGKPKYATDDIHSTMLKCWNTATKGRPSFKDISGNFKELLERVHSNVEEMDTISITENIRRFSTIPEIFICSET